MERQTPETFPATLGGDVVRCLSPEDAAAIKRADQILGSPGGGPYPRQLIVYLASMLRWYGRHRAAEKLEERHLGSPV
jgi:hypothetical protein